MRQLLCRSVVLVCVGILLGQGALHAQNVAQGKAATQSSTWSGGGGNPVAGSAVDGIRNGDYFAGSVSHTDFDANAWWSVDLGGIFNIFTISIWNRVDCCSDRLYGYRIAVQDVFNAALSSSNDLWTMDLLADPDGNAATPDVFNTGGVSGQYVKVQLLGSNWLHIAEVEVFQTPQTAVPEPISMILLGTGLAGVAAVRRRRQNHHIS